MILGYNSTKYLIKTGSKIRTMSLYVIARFLSVEAKSYQWMHVDEILILYCADMGKRLPKFLLSNWFIWEEIYIG